MLHHANRRHAVVVKSSRLADLSNGVPRNLQHRERIARVHIDVANAPDLFAVKKCDENSDTFIVRREGSRDKRMGSGPILFALWRVDQSQLLPLHRSIRYPEIFQRAYSAGLAFSGLIEESIRRVFHNDGIRTEPAILTNLDIVDDGRVHA